MLVAVVGKDSVLIDVEGLLVLAGDEAYEASTTNRWTGKLS